MGTDTLSAGRPPIIQPDYTGIMIPPNIVPLNFFITEAGVEYVVRIHSGSGSIRIPLAPWKQLLAANPGEELVMDVFVKNDSGRWSRFDSVVNRIAPEPMA